MLTHLFVPFQTAGASLVYFDFFNASPLKVELLSCIPVVSGASAVSGLVSVDLFLTRTTAIGTGGTAATMGGTSLTAATFTPHDWEGNLDSNITARFTPTGGATAGAVISWASVFTEETNAGAYTKIRDMVRLDYPDTPPIPIKTGTGFRVVQGGTASVGTVGFNVLFRAVLR